MHLFRYVSSREVSRLHLDRSTSHPIHSLRFSFLHSQLRLQRFHSGATADSETVATLQNVSTAVMDMYNGGPEVSIRAIKKDSMKFVLSNTDLRYECPRGKRWNNATSGLCPTSALTGVYVHAP